jgi:hypothetical protein
MGGPPMGMPHLGGGLPAPSLGVPMGMGSGMGMGIGMGPGMGMGMGPLPSAMGYAGRAPYGPGGMSRFGFGG